MKPCMHYPISSKYPSQHIIYNFGKYDLRAFSGVIQYASLDNYGKTYLTYSCAIQSWINRLHFSKSEVYWFQRFNEFRFIAVQKYIGVNKKTKRKKRKDTKWTGWWGTTKKEKYFDPLNST